MRSYTMIGLAKIIFKTLPWLLCVGLLSYLLISEKLNFKRVAGSKEIYQASVLKSVERIGKLEVVKYNFQEITEVTKVPDFIDFKLFSLKNPLLPDSKAVLISQGSATGCIDLTLLSSTDITVIDDTLYVTLPQPELCNFKIDLENSRLYDLQLQGMAVEKQKSFMEELYKIAEEDVKNSALKMGILEQSKTNARLVLEPLFKNVSDKPVVITFKMGQKLPITEELQ